MGRKSNTPYEIKLAAVEAYEHNEGSLKTISERFGINQKNFERWVWIYRSQGEEGLLPSNANKYWNMDIKILVAKCSLMQVKKLQKFLFGMA